MLRTFGNKYPHYVDSSYYIFTYFLAAQSYWLLLICYVFSVDIMKVFWCRHPQQISKEQPLCQGHACDNNSLVLDWRHYSKFILGCRLDYYIWLNLGIIVLPVIINLFLCIKLVYTLFRTSSPSATTVTNKQRRFYIATLIFVLSDVIVLSAFIFNIGSSDSVRNHRNTCFLFCVFFLSGTSLSTDGEILQG